MTRLSLLGLVALVAGTSTSLAQEVSQRDRDRADLVVRRLLIAELGGQRQSVANVTKTCQQDYLTDVRFPVVSAKIVGHRSVGASLLVAVEYSAIGSARDTPDRTAASFYPARIKDTAIYEVVRDSNAFTVLCNAERLTHVALRVFDK
jgi:hypothetical protein